MRDYLLLCTTKSRGIICEFQYRKVFPKIAASSAMRNKIYTMLLIIKLQLILFVSVILNLRESKIGDIIPICRNPPKLEKNYDF